MYLDLNVLELLISYLCNLLTILLIYFSIIYKIKYNLNLYPPICNFSILILIYTNTVQLY